jgi:hypothetical protein
VFVCLRGERARLLSFSYLPPKLGDLLRREFRNIQLLAQNIGALPLCRDRGLSLLGAFPFLVSLASRFDQLLAQSPDLSGMSIAYDGKHSWTGQATLPFDHYLALSLCSSRSARTAFAT